MRIESLIIENINSLAGRFEIDLSDRAYAGGLFAIVGPSGAGKTTILDAICLALYGQTPRIKTVSKTQNELMNKNAPFCKAEAIFSAGGKRYKAAFLHERSQASTPFREAKRELCVQDADGWRIIASRIREMDEKIEQITGLDFGRFTRSIMLAQFRFAEFLQADSNERAKILEQITDVDIYRRISTAIYERTKLQRDALDAIRMRIGNAKILDKTQADALVEQQQQLGQAIKQHTAQKDAIMACVNIIGSHDQAQMQLSQYQKAQDTLGFAAQAAQKQLDDAAAQEKAQAEAFEKLSETLKAVRALDLGIKMHQNEISKLQTDVNANEEQIKSHKKTLFTLFKKYFPDAQDALYKDLYLSKNIGEALRQSAAGDLKKAQQEAEKRRADLSALLKDKDIAHWQTRLREQKAALPVFEAREAMQSAKKELQQQSAQLKSVEGETKTLESKLHEAQERCDYARLEQRFGDERAKLADGQPCPLCGATAHPYAGKQSTRSFAEDADKQLKQAQSAYHEQAARISAIQTRIEDLNQVIEEKRQLLSASQGMLSAVADIDDAQALRASIKQAEEITTAYSLMQAEHAKAMQSVAALTAHFGGIDKDVEMIEARRQMIDDVEARTKRLEADKDNAQRGCDKKQSKRIALLGEKDADAEEQAAKRQLKQAQAQSELSRKKAEQAQREMEQNKANIVRVQNEAKLHAAALAEAYAKARAGASAVRSVSDDDDVKRCFEAFEESAALLDDIPDAKALSAAAQALAQLVSQEGARHAVIGQIRKADAENRDALSADKKEEKRQEKVLHKWERLNALIGSHTGDKFCRMAQGITFDALLAQANLVLARMSDRYILMRSEAGVSKPLELAVADTYQAGEVRPVANLSGGESFVVSLALALGLSEMSAGAARIDSLFIDEGFASLDESYMEAALQTLLALGSREGKLIGVISHVDALKERIDVKIEVERLSGGRATLRGPGVKTQV